MITEVRTTIYTQILTATGLDADNTFFGEAPQGTAKDPYCVFSLVSNPMERDTGAEYEDIFFQISIYGTTLASIEAIEASVRTILYNSLSALNAILGTIVATQISLQFANSLKVNENFWQNSLRYKLKIK